MITPMRILGWSSRHISTELWHALGTISRELRGNSDYIWGHPLEGSGQVGTHLLWF